MRPGLLALLLVAAPSPKQPLIGRVNGPDCKTNADCAQGRECAPHIDFTHEAFRRTCEIPCNSDEQCAKPASCSHGDHGVKTSWGGACFLGLDASKASSKAQSALEFARKGYPQLAITEATAALNQPSPNIETQCACYTALVRAYSDIGDKERRFQWLDELRKRC